MSIFRTSVDTLIATKEKDVREFLDWRAQATGPENHQSSIKEGLALMYRGEALRV